MALLGLFLHTSPLSAAITPPAQFLGHEVGADYKVARWDKIVGYFRHLDANSDRVQVRELGRTTEGALMILAEISTPETLGNLALHRQRQRKLADPRRIETAAEERQLIAESKVAVLINCNLHSSELASSQMAMELAYDLATDDAPRIREILDRTILLLVPSANPDGLDKVIDWYERTLGKPWEGSGMPWLYQKYAGHDNNRDWFMLTLPETRLLTRVLYQEWFPTIVYDIHQMGNNSVRFFVPPFHDPKNANVHPLIDQSLLLTGGHMAAELSFERKHGVVHGAMYDNWWAGGFRTTPYRHNMVGILTEAASPLIASPVFQSKSQLRGARGLPEYAMSTAMPEPWPGGWWRLRDVVEYQKISCRALLTLAARYHEMFQGNYVRMGREAVERGRTEPPFAWLVPPDQRDPQSAAHLLGILQATGLEIHQASEPFTADGVDYPSGTFVLYGAQPYRAHLIDLMERQVYPDRLEYPGGPAEPPYDIAGWTLPLQMGVRHVEVASPFACAARQLDAMPRTPSAVGGKESAAWYTVQAGRNDDFRLVNRLHKAGIPVRLSTTRPQPASPERLVENSRMESRLQAVPRENRLKAGLQTEGDAAQAHFQTGSEDAKPKTEVLYIEDGAKFRAQQGGLLKDLAVQVQGIEKPSDSTQAWLRRVALPRIGLYQPWTASIDEGWTRLVLDNFEFAYRSVHNADIRAGQLRERYDCLILPSLSTTNLLRGRAPDATEPQYVGGLSEEGVVCLQEFVRSGGTLVCLDEACNLAIEYFNLPVKNILKGKKTQEFYCPGSLLRVAVDPEHPLGYGLPPWISGYFDRSQAFEVLEAPSANRDSRLPAARFRAAVVCRYSDTVLLESGWIRGGDLIRDRPAVVEVSYGDGRVVLFGFSVQHRGQTHGTFRLLFNAIQRSTL